MSASGKPGKSSNPPLPPPSPLPPPPPSSEAKIALKSGTSRSRQSLDFIHVSSRPELCPPTAPDCSFQEPSSIRSPVKPPLFLSCSHPFHETDAFGNKHGTWTNT